MIKNINNINILFNEILRKSGRIYIVAAHPRRWKPSWQFIHTLASAATTCSGSSWFYFKWIRTIPIISNFVNHEPNLVNLENNELRFQKFSNRLPLPVKYGVSIGGVESI